VPGTKGGAALFGDVGTLSGLSFSFFQIIRTMANIAQAFGANAAG
jgi:hypothetical protein